MATHPVLSVALFYKDPFAALDWLETAFGFERTMLITNPDGTLAHSQMSFGGALFMIGTEWTDYVASPLSTGGRNTMTVSVQLTEGLDAHFAHAKASGAAVIRQPEDQFYGDRSYTVRDPEGHVWNFSQTVAVVSREDAEKASGLKIEGWF
jgi:uncharacterized glyoxalase superfamily protein PhnB